MALYSFLEPGNVHSNDWYVGAVTTKFVSASHSRLSVVGWSEDGLTPP